MTIRLNSTVQIRKCTGLENTQDFFLPPFLPKRFTFLFCRRNTFFMILLCTFSQHAISIQSFKPPCPRKYMISFKILGMVLVSSVNLYQLKPLFQIFGILCDFQTLNIKIINSIKGIHIKFLVLQLNGDTHKIHSTGHFNVRHEKKLRAVGYIKRWWIFQIEKKKKIDVCGRYLRSINICL